MVLNDKQIKIYFVGEVSLRRMFIEVVLASCIKFSLVTTTNYPLAEQSS